MSAGTLSQSSLGHMRQPAGMLTADESAQLGAAHSRFRLSSLFECAACSSGQHHEHYHEQFRPQAAAPAGDCFCLDAHCSAEGRAGRRESSSICDELERSNWAERAPPPRRARESLTTPIPSPQSYFDRQQQQHGDGPVQPEGAVEARGAWQEGPADYRAYGEEAPRGEPIKRQYSPSVHQEQSETNQRQQQYDRQRSCLEPEAEHQVAQRFEAQQAHLQQQLAGQVHQCASLEMSQPTEWVSKNELGQQIIEYRPISEHEFYMHQNAYISQPVLPYYEPSHALLPDENLQPQHHHQQHLHNYPYYSQLDDDNQQQQQHVNAYIPAYMQDDYHHQEALALGMVEDQGDKTYHLLEPQQERQVANHERQAMQGHCYSAQEPYELAPVSSYQQPYGEPGACYESVAPDCEHQLPVVSKQYDPNDELSCLLNLDWSDEESEPALESAGESSQQAARANKPAAGHAEAKQISARLATPVRAAGCSQETRDKVRMFVSRRLRLRAARAACEQQVAPSDSAITPAASAYQGPPTLRPEGHHHYYARGQAPGSSANASAVNGNYLAMRRQQDQRAAPFQPPMPVGARSPARIETIRHYPAGASARANSLCSISSSSSPSLMSDDELAAQNTKGRQTEVATGGGSSSSCSVDKPAGLHANLGPITRHQSRTTTTNTNTNTSVITRHVYSYGSCAVTRKLRKGSSSSYDSASSDEPTRSGCDQPADEIGVQTRASKRRKRELEQQHGGAGGSASPPHNQFAQNAIRCDQSAG